MLNRCTEHPGMEEGTVPHPTRTGIMIQITLWSLKH